MLNFARGDKSLYLLFWFIQACAVGLSLYAHQCGFLMTPDSVEYLAAARSFRENSVLLGSDGTPFVYWPPLFPILLSFFDNPLDGLFWINMVSQLLIGLAIFKLAKALLETFVFRIIFIACSLLSVHLIMPSVFVWSDLIFIGLALWNFYFASTLTENPKTSWTLFLITGFLLCLQRNAGLFWVIPTDLWLLISLPYNLKKRIMVSMAVLTITTSGFWYWNIGNPTQMSIWIERIGLETFIQIAKNAYLVGINLGRMYAPINGWIAFLLFLVTLSTIVLILRQQLLTHAPLQLMGLILTAYIFGYLLYDKLDPHDLDRYLAALLPLTYALALMALEVGVKRRPTWVQMAARALLFLWAFYPVIRAVNNVLLWHDMSCKQVG